MLNLEKPTASTANSYSETILHVQELTKRFTLHEQNKILPGVAPVSLTVNAGQLTVLTGASGAGKSSLLKCVYRTYLPSAGKIVYRTAQGAWVDLATVSERTIIDLRRTEISFVTQFLHFLPRQTTIDVVARPLFDLGLDREVAHGRAIVLLRQMQIPERLWKISPASFSGGEKQRVNLARSVILRPRLLLLDEPTASLDTASTQRIIDLIRTIKQTGTGMLAVFHDSDLIEALADRVVTIQTA